MKDKIEEYALCGCNPDDHYYYLMNDISYYDISKNNISKNNIIYPDINDVCILIDKDNKNIFALKKDIEIDFYHGDAPEDVTVSSFGDCDAISKYFGNSIKINKEIKINFLEELQKL